MTEITDAGDVAARTTETMGYPLPPTPPRFQPKWNHYRQYMLPSPSTGRPTAFARATTVSGTLDDTYQGRPEPSGSGLSCPAHRSTNHQKG